MYRLICQKPVHFLSAQMALVSTFFQMFIVLGMYNFGQNVGIRVACLAQEIDPTFCTAAALCGWLKVRKFRKIFFLVFNSSKKTYKIFRLSAQASKKWSDQKNKNNLLWLVAPN